ncbi:MAG: tetratricopeptide repeat protein [Spirochaetes bacterium]|nr:tetratricopeptide repeat protein [Spirochaetota bacterium]MBN2770659.1 tetratricopeptide repeat protein [Spirochaetota bacterium]
MYYRYKKNKGPGVLFKVLFAVIFFGVLFYFANRYQEYLFFWRYTVNQISSGINSASLVEDEQRRIEILRESYKKSLDYAEANPLSREAFFTLANAAASLAEAESSVKFSSYILNDNGSVFDRESRDLLLESMKALKKGIALDERQVVADSILVLASKLDFYTGYSEMEKIFSYIALVSDPASLSDVEDRRFYGLMLVLKGDVDAGVAFLRNHGQIASFSDRLFFSGALKKAGQYTDAIVEYKELLSEQPSKEHEVYILYNLGEIYYEQSLYNEALEELLKLQLVKPDDARARNLTGQIYLKLGDKKSAEAYLGGLGG